MTFATQIAADMAVIFNTDEFGETATYAGVEITVVEAETAERNTGLPGFVVPLFSIYVKASDVERPKAGDAVTFRGVTCRVGQFPISDGGVWLVDLERMAVQA
jgi:hypothetical protein